MQFAENTTVAVDRTKLELDKLLQKHGATQRMMGHDDDRGLAIVGFTMAGRQVRLKVPLPKLVDFAKKPDPRWRGHFKDVPKEKQLRDYEQACRSRWRAALLVVKAKLEYIAMNQSTVDQEFLANISLPDGGSVLDFLHAGLDEAYLNGRMPPLLGSGGER